MRKGAGGTEENAKTVRTQGRWAWWPRKHAPAFLRGSAKERKREGRRKGRWRAISSLPFPVAFVLSLEGFPLAGYSLLRLVRLWGGPSEFARLPLSRLRVLFGLFHIAAGPTLRKEHDEASRRTETEHRAAGSRLSAGGPYELLRLPAPHHAAHRPVRAGRHAVRAHLQPPHSDHERLQLHAHGDGL